MPAEFIWIPDPGAEGESEPRVSELGFGEGYEQVLGRGINRIKKTRRLVFSNRTDAEADAIEAFLELKKGTVSFTYSHKGGPIKNYRTVGSWKRVDVEYNRNTITVTFKEVP